MKPLRNLKAGCSCIMQTYNQIERVYAGFWVRLAAYLIDSVIVFAGRTAVRLVLFVSLGIFGAHNPLNGTFLFQYSWKDGILYAIGICYFVLLTYHGGVTLGKRAMNLRVVSADGEKLTLLNVLYRETIGRFLSAFLLCAGYIMVGVTDEKTGLHDILCDTRVVYARKIPAYTNEEIHKQYVHCENPKAQPSWSEPVQPVQSESAQPEQDQSEKPQPEPVESMLKQSEPTRVIETPDRKISIYERYEHIENPGERK